jgi:phosphate/sulfate permease
VTFVLAPVVSFLVAFVVTFAIRQFMNRQQDRWFIDRERKRWERETGGWQ